MSELISLIKTTHNREVFLRYLDMCQESKSITKVSLNDNYDSILASLGITQANQLTTEFIQSLKAQLLNTSIVKINVNEILTKSFIDRLYAILFPNNEGLIEIELNPFSNGGFVLYKDGIIYNYLFENLIHTSFSDANFRQRITQLL